MKSMIVYGKTLISQTLRDIQVERLTNVFVLFYRHTLEDKK